MLLSLRSADDIGKVTFRGQLSAHRNKREIDRTEINTGDINYFTSSKK